MDFLSKFNLGAHPVLRIVGVGVVVILGLAVLVTLLGSFSGIRHQSGYGVSTSVAPGAPTMRMGMSAVDTDNMMVYEEQARISMPGPEPMPNDGYVGNDAEDFEVTSYTANIETNNLAEDCTTVANLKARSDVIFEQAHESTKQCRYTFKVEHAITSEVLETINALDPKELAEHTQTIKSHIEDYASREAILRRKLETIEATLVSAETAYDELVTLSRDVRDVESLATVIDSKVRTIERLTNERLSITTQLDTLLRQQAIAQDRLNYTYFTVSIYEQKYVDGEIIRNSWKSATRQFVLDINRTLQDLTINFVGFVLLIVKFALYAFVILFVVRAGWKFVRQTWIDTSSSIK